MIRLRAVVPPPASFLLVAVAVLAAGHGSMHRDRAAALALFPLAIGMVLPRGRDPRREAEAQAAYEDAERVRAERRAGVVFDSFIDSSPSGIEVFGVDGSPLRSNKAAERLLGKVPPPGIPLPDERGLKRAGLLEPQLKRVLAGTRVETPPTWYDPTEIGLPGIPGRKVCFRATVFPLFDNEGKITRIAVMYEDVTEIKKAEQALRESEEKLRAAATVTPAPTAAAPVPEDARDIEFQRRKIELALRESEERFRALFDSARGYVVARFTDEGQIVAVSPTIEEYWGINRDEVIRDNTAFFGQVHPDDLSRVKATETQVRKSGEYPPGHRFRVVHKSSGTVRWLEMRGSAVPAAGRRVVDALILDVTDCKSDEDMLREREANLAAIKTSAGDGVFTIDKDWVIRDWSPGAEKETRVTQQEAVGKRLWDVYPDLERSGFAAPFRKAMLDRKPQFHEGFYQDGREKYAGWFTLALYPYGTGVLAFVRNVSQRKRAEMAWQETDAKLKALFEQPGIFITIKDKNLRYVMTNKAALKAMARAGETIIGKTDPEIYNARVSGLLTSHDRQVLEQGSAVELELALPDGANPNATWYHIIKQPWLNTANEALGVLDVAFDVTARVRAQQELAHRREYLEKLLAEQSGTLRKAQEELTRWTK